MKEHDFIYLARVTCKEEECYQFVTKDFADNHKGIKVIMAVYKKELNTKREKIE